MSKLKFQRPTGMHDILPQDQAYFQKIYDTCKSVVEFYNFEKIDTPILEETELFIKGTGGSTDVVQKQMYSLKTKGGDQLTLRPEFTPGIIRAYIEHGMKNLSQPVKLYAIGPVFRFEKPQAGRYRQFHQFNLEVVGEKNPIADAQIIQIFHSILSELNFKKLVIKINSIGDDKCRPAYRRALIKYCRSKKSALCSDCRRRLEENPLRVLDCKEEKCRKVVEQAPQIINHLCEECHNHFKSVLEFLDEMKLSYFLDPYLVRGLDYYTKTTFEIFSDDVDNEKHLAKNALAGGGRYDNLVKMFGGGEVAALGAAMGIERVVLAMKEKGVHFSRNSSHQIFLAQLGMLAKRKSLGLLEDLRKSKIKVLEASSKDSLKTQLSIASKANVKYSLLLGQQEALDGTIIIKEMESGKQETIKLDKAIEKIKKYLRS